MKKSVLLEIAATNIDEAKFAIEAAGFSLGAHESKYHGGRYFRGDRDGASLLLKENFIEDDGEPTEAGFPNASYLIYVDGAVVNVDKILDCLGQLGNILRSSTY